MRSLFSMLLFLSLISCSDNPTVSAPATDSALPKKSEWTEKEVEVELALGMTPDAVIVLFGEPDFTVEEGAFVSQNYSFGTSIDNGSYLGGITVIYENNKLVKWMPVLANRRTIE